MRFKIMAVNTKLAVRLEQTVTNTAAVAIIPTLNNADTRMAFVVESISTRHLYTPDLLTATVDLTVRFDNAATQISSNSENWIAGSKETFADFANSYSFIQLPFPVTLAQDSVYASIATVGVDAGALLKVDIELYGYYTKLSELEWVKARCPDA
jgi:hypothetical protein